MALPPVRCGLPGLVRYGIVVLPRCLVLCCVGLVRHLLYDMLLVLLYVGLNSAVSVFPGCVVLCLLVLQRACPG